MGDTTDRWRIRRRMAWYSLFAGLLYPALLVIVDGTALSTISIPFYGFVTTVVVAYIGGAVVDDKWQRPPP